MEHVALRLSKKSHMFTTAMNSLKLKAMRGWLTLDGLTWLRTSQLKRNENAASVGRMSGA